MSDAPSPKLTFENQATGELEELDVSTPAQIQAMYRYASAMEKAAKDLREALWPYGEYLVSLHDGKTYQFDDGHQLNFVTTQRFEVPPKVVLSEIDIDVILPALKITKGKLEDIIKDLVSKNEIDQEVVEKIKKSYKPVSSSRYFKVEKTG